MKLRKAKMIVNKSGSGSTTFRATLPATWIREMGLDEDDRDLILSFDGNKITIQNIKGEVDMLKYEEFMLKIEKITGGSWGRIDKYITKEEFENVTGLDITSQWNNNNNWSSNEYDTNNFTLVTDLLEGEEIIDVIIDFEVNDEDEITHISIR